MDIKYVFLLVVAISVATVLLMRVLPEGAYRFAAILELDKLVDPVRIEFLEFGLVSI